MQMKLKFENAIEISSKNVRDELHITVLDNQYFWSEESYLRVPIDFEMYHKVPP